VLSSDKYRPLVNAVRDQGGFVGLIYVALATPELVITCNDKRYIV